MGSTGPSPALPFLLEGLARLEYRGYDSAGVALHDEGRIWRRRREGKLAELASAVGDAPAAAITGIGHTRWATHGRPSEANAHPHVDCTGRLAIIHNGIIENYLELGDGLVARGHELESETDTEVLAHLIEENIAAGISLADSVRLCLRRVVGSFAVAVIHADEPELIVAARRSSPLIAGRTDELGLVASDIPALLSQTREVYVLDDDQVVEVRPGQLKVTDLQGNEVPPNRRHVDWDLDAAERGGFPDFMLKEIHEQPGAVAETLRGRTHRGRLVLDTMRLGDDELRAVDRVFIVGCGTSYHAGMVAKHAIEHWARVPCEIEIASEFRYRDPVFDAESLVVGVSQSGETLDTMEACRFARTSTNKAKVLAVCNVVDSSMAREADAVIYTRAGPEIGVAATKTHVAQIVGMEILALYLAQLRGTLYPAEIFALVDAIAAGQQAQALRLLHLQLDHATSSPTDFALYLIRMLARQVRILLRIRLGRDVGRSTTQITAELKIPRYYADRYFRQAGRLSKERLVAAFEQLASLEQALKTGKTDPGAGLDLLVADLCA